MKEIDFVKFYAENIIQLPLKSKSDIQIYRLVMNSEYNISEWYSDDILDKLFNQPIHKNPTILYVYKFCRDNKELFINKEI